ncbi:hypothetical protein FBR05_00315 [Deltaproteobacteria bacterium PRO3]|nr:hypothetical protein [Deltaproteobacteria bacterium PRO3]
MKKETEYRYRQRIKDLEQDRNRANRERDIYRSIAHDIYNVVCECVENNTAISKAWILKQVKRALV